jgi:arylsulfatase A-like enzyme
VTPINYPDLVYDNHQVEPPKTPEEGYDLTEDLAEKAIGFIADLKQVAPDKPFFLYFAPGATHAPHHVPKQWADKYKGNSTTAGTRIARRYSRSRRKLGIMPKEPSSPAMTPTCRIGRSSPQTTETLCANDGGVRRILRAHGPPRRAAARFLEQLGELDNTLIMLISDNGARSEGGPNGSVNENKFLQ